TLPVTASKSTSPVTDRALQFYYETDYYKAKERRIPPVEYLPCLPRIQLERLGRSGRQLPVDQWHDASRNDGGRYSGFSGVNGHRHGVYEQQPRFCRREQLCHYGWRQP